MRLKRKVASCLADRRGVAAVEFALIVPMMLAMYLVTMEAGQGIDANKKVSRVGSMVADLITQQQTITASELVAIMQIGESTLQPYNRSRPTITVTAIEITDETTPKVKVAWSHKLVDGNGQASPYVKGSPTTVPDKLKIKGSFLVRVVSSLNYEPFLTYTEDQKSTLGLGAILGAITMSETYHLRPRMSSSVSCADC